MRYVPKPHLCDEIPIRLLLNSKNRGYFGSLRNGSVLAVLVFANNRKGLLIVDESASKDQKEREKRDFQLRMAAIAVSLLLLHAVIHQLKHVPTQLRVVEVVLVRYLDQHEGLSADHVRDDVNQQRQFLYFSPQIPAITLQIRDLLLPFHVSLEQFPQFHLSSIPTANPT